MFPPPPCSPSSSSSSSSSNLFMNEILNISNPYTKPILTSQTQDIELGLNSLTICPKIDQKHHNFCIMTSNLFSHMGDYIGMESCVDLKNYEDVSMGGGGDSEGVTDMVHCRNRDERCAMKKNEFPPPISLLARTENLPSHMPFVLKRYYTNDGRLILREEKVRHHEYFRAHRSNGHLTLQLVPLDDDGDDSVPPFDENNENNEQHCEESQTDTENDDRCTYINKKVEEEEEVLDKNERTVNGGSGVCLNYSNVIMSSSCFLGLPVPAIKAVST